MSKAPSKAKTRKNGGRLKDVFDPVADAKAREKILSARVSLVLNHGFFGNLAMRLKLENGDTWCETAATDGRKFYYNTDFINAMSVGNMMFLFCHELLHAAYDHVGRTTRAHNPKLANIAMDYVVNADLIKHGLGTKIDPCLYDRKYDGWSWEQVYDDLRQNVKEVTIDELAEMLLDEHLESKGSGNGDGEGDGNNDSKGKGRPSIDEKDRQNIKDEIKEALLAAHAATGGAGNLPSGLKRIIGDLTEPKINWKDFINQQIQSTVKNDYTYAVPARKNFANGFSLPSMKKDEAIDVCVGIDTSGSISNKQLKEFVSEVAGIMGTYDDYKVRLWCFDTHTYAHAEFDPSNGHEINDYEAPGGGGTNFDVNWQYMKDNDIEPKLFIMFTDGEPYGSWGDENYCETVFIINNPHNRNIKPPFGVYAYYDSAA